MLFANTIQRRRYPPQKTKRSFWRSIHIDIYLLLGIISLISLGLIILYSASSQNLRVLEQQILHIALAFIVMILFAQIPPVLYQRWAVLFYSIGVLLLIAVLIVGHTGKGAERWLSIGIIRFQPSEIMKLALPLFLASYFHTIHLPLNNKSILTAVFIIFIPVILVIKQPDQSTAVLLLIAGGSILLFAGLSWRLLGGLFGFAILCSPLLWYIMHPYQRQRILTFLNPERDPLGTSYHIIQSKIAIGSGGFFGKGWLNGTQSHLYFLPEHSTDFIFAVCGEEFGFLGSIILIMLFMIIILRGLYITIHAQDTFSRLLAGSLTLTFFFSFFINMGMVTGILPVMGLPLPLISYGGSSMVTLMAGLGILMSIQTHRKLLTT
jgi:rod shape determining protein RodA